MAITLSVTLPCLYRHPTMAVLVSHGFRAVAPLTIALVAPLTIARRQVDAAHYASSSRWVGTDVDANTRPRKEHRAEILDEVPCTPSCILDEVPCTPSR